MTGGTSKVLELFGEVVGSLGCNEGVLSVPFPKKVKFLGTGVAK